MTGDAKLALLLGVGVVVAAALVYYRPDGAQAKPKDAAAVKAYKSTADGLQRTVQLSPPSDGKRE